MELKTGVKIDSLCAELSSRLEELDNIHKVYFSSEVRITSGHEGYSGDRVHGKNSLHYKGRAIDIGWQFHIVNVVLLSGFLINLMRIFDNRLFDVMFEIDHIHIEYDPH